MPGKCSLAAQRSHPVMGIPVNYLATAGVSHAILGDDVGK